MNMIKMLRVSAYFVLIPLYTIVGACILFILFPFFRRRRYVDFLQRLWMRLILWTCGVRVSVEGLENLEQGKMYVFVANHQSLFDIPACFAVLPARLRMLAKKELFRIPVFGWGMWTVGHIIIDRENREKAVKSVDEAADRLKREDISPVVYPEGTRSPDGKIYPFKKGAFVLAIKSKREVVPLTIIGSRKIAPKKSLVISPGEIHLVIHRPIETDTLTLENRGDLAKKTHDIIVERFYSDPGKITNEKVSESSVREKS
ncbi:lysophospholipid acyltransferase family protein [candidate division KSB1 bacterium]